VVVGGGGAALMAAVEAADGGARVLVLEKHVDVGGATATSIGSFSAAGTDLQEAAGVTGDTVEAHYQDILKFIPRGQAGVYNLERTRLNIERAPATLARLRELGVTFVGVRPEPPHSVYRMHNVWPSSRVYIDVLTRAAWERGVTIRTEMQIEQVCRDDSGAVTGVVVQDLQSRQTTEVNARQGVVLAFGVFRPDSDLAQIVTGAGMIVMGQARARDAIDAHSHSLDFIQVRTITPPYMRPPDALWKAGAIIVNRHGRRYANELTFDWIPRTLAQTERMGYVLFDQELADQIARPEDDSQPDLRDGWFLKGKLTFGTMPGIGWGYLEDLRRHTRHLFEADTLAELARMIWVPAHGLADEVATYNRTAKGEVADRFGRDRLGPGLTRPPFYAWGPVGDFGGRTYINGCSVKTDSEMRVLGENDSVIPGLYAAGGTAECDAFLGGHGHHLAHAFGTGIVAGRHVALERPRHA
jgi:hypothetical protein